MSDFEVTGERRAEVPDWNFDTNEDLRDHAFLTIGENVASLLEKDEDPDRPEGAIGISVVSIPCPDGDNLNRQVLYLGYCAEACQDLGLVIRQAEAKFYGEVDQHYACLVLCSADGLTRAQVELAAQDHPERSTRSH